MVIARAVTVGRPGWSRRRCQHQPAHLLDAAALCDESAAARAAISGPRCAVQLALVDLLIAVGKAAVGLDQPTRAFRNLSTWVTAIVGAAIHFLLMRAVSGNRRRRRA